MGPIFVDLAHTLRALEFMPFVEKHKEYVRTLSSHVVVILSAFDDKVNTIYLGRPVQDSIALVSSIPEYSGDAVGNLRGALKGYNKLVGPQRRDLAFVRNTIAAHRDISTLEVHRATEKLTVDFLNRFVVATFALHTAYTEVCFSVYEVLTRRLTNTVFKQSL